jgi:hypothetical protein
VLSPIPVRVPVWCDPMHPCGGDLTGCIIHAGTPEESTDDRTECAYCLRSMSRYSDCECRNCSDCGMRYCECDDDDDDDDGVRYGYTATVNGSEFTDTDYRLGGISHKHRITDGTSTYVLKCMSEEECAAEYVMPRIFQRANIMTQTVSYATFDGEPFCSACESGTHPLSYNPEERDAVLCAWVDGFNEGMPWDRMGRTDTMLDLLTVACIDYLARNDDRHSGNYGNVNGRVCIIDNGLAYRGHRRSSDFSDYVNVMGWSRYINTLTVGMVLQSAIRALNATLQSLDDMTEDQRIIALKRIDTFGMEVGDWSENYINDSDGTIIRMVLKSENFE